MAKQFVKMGGAHRAEKKPNYVQIPLLALRRLARRFSLGAVEYDDPAELQKLRGKMNWQAGNEEFLRDAFNHMLEHIFLWKDGDTSDDHLAAAMWACAVFMWHEEQGALAGKVELPPQAPRKKGPVHEPYYDEGCTCDYCSEERIRRRLQDLKPDTR